MMSPSMRQMFCPRWLAIALCTCLATAALPTTLAYSQDAQLQKALEGATEDYDLAMLDDAESKLLDGLKYAEGNGQKSPEVAKLHVMLGIVIFARDRDADAAEKQFIAALEMDAKAELPEVYATPDLTKLFQSAKSKAKPPKTDNPQTNPTTQSPKDFKHERITKAPAGKDLQIEAFVPADMPVFKMVVHHKRFGEDAYQSVEMSPTDAVRFAGKIPGAQVRTSQLAYYIEALDRGGNVLAKIADAKNPVEILVTGSGDVKDPGPGPGPGPGPDPDPTPSKPSAQVVYFALGAGSGVGFLPGGEATANPGRDVKPGIAPTFGHAMLDLGWIINNSMRLGLYFRWQFSPYQDFSAPNFPEDSKGGTFPSTRDECLGLGLPGDCLLGLKYRYFFEEDPDAVRIYSSVGLGVGRVRNWLELRDQQYVDSAQTTLNPNCVGKEIFIDPGENPNTTADDLPYCYIRDTVRTGWGHFGVGAGVSVPLAKSADFVADSYLMFHTLDYTSVNLDLTLGFNFRF